jgi:hypothetical protein
MNKHFWHHIWATRIRPVKVWYLLCSVVCVMALRQNNQQMGTLRDAVYVADENKGDVVGALQNLQAYVGAHMNTSLTAGSSVYPPIQLKFTYERLQSDANTKYNQANAAVYTEAQKYCEQQNSTDFSGRNRVPCIESYVAAHGVAPSPVIPDSMYKFNFASPSWSPDLAGWTLVLSMLLFVVVLVRICLGWLLPRVTK